MTFDPKRSFVVEENHTIRKPIYEFLFDFYEHHLSSWYRFRDIRLRSFKGFDLDLWPQKIIYGSKNLYDSKAHIWLTIWPLWTQSLYLVPFSRYSTSKFSGFDLDLWPRNVIWGQKKLYHSIAHIWLPIWLLWTPSLYLLPFSRYSTSEFLGFDLDLLPQNVIRGPEKLYNSRAHIWLTIRPLWTPSLYLVPFSRYSTSESLGFDLDPWPRKVIWSWKKFYHSKAHIWLPIWHLWTPSRYLVPFPRYSTSKFLGFDLDLLPQNVIRGPEKLYNSIAHLWLTIRPLWTPSLNLVPFSRYSTSKFLSLTLTFDPKKSSGVEKSYTIREPIYDLLFDLYGHHLSSSYRSRDIRLRSFSGSTLTFDPKRSSGGEKNYGIRKPISDFLFDFYEHHLFISCRFRDIRLQSFQGLTLTFDPKRSSGAKKFQLFESPYRTYYLTSMDTISLSRTILEIFDYKVFRVRPWPLTPKGHLGSQKIEPFESPYMTYYLTSMDTISLSHLSREIRLQSFQSLTLTFDPKKVIWSWRKSYHSKAYIWVPIWLLRTPSL